MAEDNGKKESDKAEDKKSPTDSEAGAISREDENQIPTEGHDAYTKSKHQIRWEKASTIASIVLAIIAGIGIILVWVQINQTEDALSISGEALAVTRKTLDAARENMRLEQRPWLGYYGYGIQARENSTAMWEYREPKIGEEFRIRCSIQNTGKTPALNISMMPIILELVPIGGSAKSPEWSGGQPGQGVLFPNAKDFSHDGGAALLTDQQFLEYSTLKKEIFFWAGLSYTDFAGELYWVSVGVSHSFGSDSYKIKSSFVVPISAVARSKEDQN